MSASTAEERFEALAGADAVALETLADRILATGVAIEVVDGPRVAAGPVRVPVPGTGGTAVLGRVVLTLCEVRLAGARGDAAVEGRAPRAALAAAICDAEAERAGPLAGEVATLAAGSAARRAERLRDEARAVALTRTDEGRG